MDNRRREFLRRLSVLTGSSIVLAHAPWIAKLKGSPSAKISPIDKVRLGVIGVGNRGRKLLLHLKQMPEVDIAAVCDIYEPHYERAIELSDGKAKAFSDYRELLEMNDLDGVLIATPVYLHARMTNDALRSGKHVLCEKAMGMTVEECRSMVETHRETGNNLLIGHQRMFDIGYLEALKRMRQGDFGPMTHVKSHWYVNNSWRRDVPEELNEFLNWRIIEKYSLGLMTELACHITQVVNWFKDSVPEKVCGSGSIVYWKDGRDTYDNVNVVYRYPDGTNFTFNSNMSNWHYGLEQQLMGPQYSLELQQGRYFAQNPPPAPGILQLITDIEDSVFQTLPLGGASWVINTGSEQKGKYFVDEYPKPDATSLELEAFVQSIRDGKQTPGVLEQGYYGSVAAILGHMAMKKESTVRFEKEIML